MKRLRKAVSVDWSGLEAFHSALQRLKSAMQTPLPDTKSFSASLRSFSGALKRLDLDRMNLFGESWKNLQSALSAPFPDLSPITSALSQMKSSLSVGKTGASSVEVQITSIASAVGTLPDDCVPKLQSLTGALGAYAAVGRMRMSSTIAAQLSGIGQAMENILPSDRELLEGLSAGLEPLTRLGNPHLTPFINQLKKLPEALQALETIDLDSIRDRIIALSNAMEPLAKQGAALASLPALMRSLQRIKNPLQDNSTGSGGFLTSRVFRPVITTVFAKQLGDQIGNLVKKSNDYQENLNLFTVSLGKYAESAKQYGNTVSEVLGIDLSDWLRNQGIFQTLTTGFGVVSSRALVMSKNLTQLGYDISSFFNLPIEDSMQKLQSAISGEIEPIRRLGYDLSQAKLQAVALSLGIEKQVSAMTQAEKAELRYYALLTQVTEAQGDMARTLEAPANQVRILSAQFAQAGRAVGNIFIPALNAVLPYAIAVVKAVRAIADSVASLLGFQITEVDYSGLGGITSGADDAADSLGNASEQAKTLKNYLMGFDELNVISPLDSAGGTGTNTGAGFDFELPEYDFLGDAVSTRIDQISAKIQPLISWIQEHLKEIGETVAAVGAGMLAWKISDSVRSFLSSFINGGFNKIATGITLMVTGVTLEASGAYHIGYGDAKLWDYIKTAVGAALNIAGALLTFGTGPLGWTVGIAMSLAVMLTAVQFGRSQALKEEDIQSHFGTIQLGLEDCQKLAENLCKEPWYFKIQTTLNNSENLSAEVQKIEKQLEPIQQMNWQASVGLKLTEEEISSYKSAIDSYVEGCQNYIKERGHTIELGLAATLNVESVTYQNISASNARATTLLDTELTRLGKELQKTVNDAFGDGLLDFDEQKIITELIQKQQRIISALNDAKNDAALDLLGQSWSGKDLTKSSYDQLVQEMNAVKDEMNANAKSAVAGIITQLRGNVNGLELLVTEEPNNAEYRAELEKARAALQEYLDAKPLEMALKLNSAKLDTFQLNTLAETYGAALDDILETALSTGQNLVFGPQTPETVLGWMQEDNSAYQSYLEAFVQEINTSMTRLNLSEMLKKLAPNREALQGLVEEYAQAGKEPPAAFVQALTDTDYLYGLMAAAENWNGDSEKLKEILLERFAPVKTEVADTVTEAFSEPVDVTVEVAPQISTPGNFLAEAKTMLEKNFSAQEIKAEPVEVPVDISVTPTAEIAAVNTTAAESLLGTAEQNRTAVAEIQTEVDTGLTGIQTAQTTAQDTMLKSQTEFGSSASTAVTGLFSGISTAQTNFYKDTNDGWNTFSAAFNTGWTDFWNGLGTFTADALNSIIANVEIAANDMIDGLNAMIDGLNELASLTGHSYSKIEGVALKRVAYAAVEMQKKADKEIGQYASGGFPTQGELFIARESGAEMVGSIGRRTAVANNDQIVDAVSAGVYEAVRAAGSREESGGTQEIRVYLDGKQIAAAVEKRNRERGRTLLKGGLSYGR